MAASSRSASFAYTAATALPEPHIGSEPGGEVEQLVTGDRVGRERVDRVQRGCRVARSTAQTGLHGDPLGQLDGDAELVPDRFQDGAGGTHREILLRRPEVGSMHR